MKLKMMDLQEKFASGDRCRKPSCEVMTDVVLACHLVFRGLSDRITERIGD